MRAAGGVAALRRFARARPAAVERCDVCGTPLDSSHEHRLIPRERRLECVCPSCGNSAAGHESPWKLVRPRALLLHDVQIAEDKWGRMGIPIRLAFFVVSGHDARTIAFFPSPAGATESYVEPGEWAEIRDRSPLLCAMRPDVEALLVNHLGDAREHHLVSIDVCYRLVGTIRTHWRGFGGGAEVWSEIERMMAAITAIPAKLGEGDPCPL